MKALTLLVCGVLAIISPAAKGARIDGRESARIPVLAWGGPPPAQANASRYRELAECGFTHSFSGFANIDDMARALDAANEAGGKLLLSCPELRSDPESTVRRLKNHPAMGSYFLQI